MKIVKMKKGVENEIMSERKIETSGEYTITLYLDVGDEARDDGENADGVLRHAKRFARVEKRRAESSYQRPGDE